MIENYQLSSVPVAAMRDNVFILKLDCCETAKSLLENNAIKLIKTSDYNCSYDL